MCVESFRFEIQTMCAGPSSSLSLHLWTFLLGSGFTRDPAACGGPVATSSSSLNFRDRVTDKSHSEWQTDHKDPGPKWPKCIWLEVKYFLFVFFPCNFYISIYLSYRGDSLWQFQIGLYYTLSYHPHWLSPSTPSCPT
jgi:hypothetical protein